MIKYILNSIRNKDADSKLSVVLRHPRREEMTDVTDSFNTPLVNEGREMAVKLGKKLFSHFSYNFYHSHVPRCIETADLILKGINNSKKDEKSKISGVKEFLGGFFLLDSNYILNLVNEISGDVFIAKWYENKLDQNKIIPFQKTSNLLIQYILESIDEDNKNVIEFFITHDWNIIPIMSKVLDITGPDFFWPSYFEPIILEKTVDEINISFREHCKSFEVSP